MVQYTVAMCNYNMVETLEESVTSIRSQLNEDFEVLVLDGGSDDGSVALLRDLEARYENVRAVALPPNDERHLGADRQLSLEAAAGEYVLFDLDCDDRYNDGIADFVEVYHQIEDAQGGKFILKGESINMAPRSLMMDIPFRNVGMAEDKDLYRRAMAEDAIVFVKHYPIWKNIGYDTTATARTHLERMFRVQMTSFRTGITLRSYLYWLLVKNWGYTDHNWKRVAAELAMAPFAWLLTDREFSLPEEFRTMGRQYEVRDEIRGTLSELEDQYDFEIDRSQLSDRGLRMFYGDGVEDLSPGIPEVRDVTI